MNKSILGPLCTTKQLTNFENEVVGRMISWTLGMIKESFYICVSSWIPVESYIASTLPM